ncbi:MAG: beta-glucosidase BglX [Clostridia bacterium]|nr:beta-glucosidase BglX [Clostridia bacterium]
MANLETLLAGMTFDEKIGQLAQYNATLLRATDAEITGPDVKLGIDKEDIKNVGSVLNFKTVEDVIEMQKRHLEIDRNKIPLVFMMDVIHGCRTIYPIPLALGASFDEELVADCTKMAAKEASACGIHVTFAPMVDYVRDARWGRVMETCGEEPLVNSRMGATQVKAYQGTSPANIDNVAACVKHFAAYGGAEAGKDYNTVDIAERTLREFHFPAYKACIDAGAKLLMPSFNSLNGIPSTANKWLMNKVLGDEWGYDGVVISDYNAIGELIKHGVAADKKEAARLAFEAGCDIEMCSSAYYHHLKELLAEGVITMEQIDAAVMRVLKFKDSIGLFDDPYHGASVEREKEVCLSDENRKIARRAAADCAVLLKNEGVLPLNKNIKTLALIGPFADEHKIIGFWSCYGKNEESVSVEEGFKAALPNTKIITVKGCTNELGDTDKSGFKAAIKAAKKADAVILCLGEPQDYSGEGNCRTDLTLPGVQEELAKEIVKVNKNTAALLFNGRPMVFTSLANTVPALLEMWFPGTEGGTAAADIILGDVNPSGKLTMTFPKATGQCPIYYNRTNTGRPKPVDKDDVRKTYCSSYIDCGNLPLYSFGHGLSYSNFIYEGMELDKCEMDKNGEIKVTVTVYNDSDVCGKETVQLYMRDMVASVVRPIQQLIDYKKVEIGAHERAEVTFTVKEEQLRFWNFENKLVSEAGKFTLYTGYADHLLHAKEFELK